MNRESRGAMLSRRSFLKAVGATAAMLPFYQMLENNFVRAQTAELPLKFLGIGCYHGSAGQLWSRRAGETNTNFSLTYPHSPFADFDNPALYGKSFKDKINIFEGFDYGVGEFDSKGNSMHVAYHGAMGLFLTGSCKDNNQVLNASLDQYLAAKYGGKTRFRSLQIRTYDQWDNPLDSQWCMSFDSTGTPLAPMWQPTAIWDKFFAGAIVGADPAAIAAAARKRAAGASILDYVTKDIQSLSTRLAGDERAKLDQHLTVIRGLEQRLDTTMPSGAQCTTPPRRDPASNGYDLDKFTDGNIKPICDFTLELLAEILACDLTRFATFLMPTEFGPSNPGVSMKLIYDGSTVPAVDGTEASAFPVYNNMHDNCAHRLDDGDTPQALMSQRMVSAIQRMYFSRIAKLMQRLEQAGVLDSTLILAGNEGGHGAAHDTRQVPFLLAGGANGKVKFGQRIVAPTRTAQVEGWCKGDSLTSHNPLLVSIANLFGENLTKYGTCGNSELLQGVSTLLG